MDPQQEYFSRLKIDLEAMGFSVYDGDLPPADTPYPFVYLGEFRQPDTANKSAVFGIVYPPIHVWHNDPRQRGTVSQMLLSIKTACRMLDHTENFAWHVREMTQRIINDDTTNAPLLHGVIEAGVAFS